MTHIRPVTALSEEEVLFQQEVEKFADERIRPLVAKMDEEERMDPGLIAGLFELGLMGIEIPGDFQGSEGSFFMAILAVEALSKVDASVGVLCDVQNTLVNNIFLRWAHKDQKEKYLPRLASSAVGSYCLTEADSGSDAFALKTRAWDEGSHYRLQGKKIFITNALEAEVFVVFANLDPHAGYRGITAFIVEKSFENFGLGKKEVKLGIRASSTCEVVLDDVLVPKENLLGQEGKGYKIAIETLNEGRIGIAAQMLGLAQGAHEAAVKYANERSQFGKKIKEYQGIQFQLAQQAVAIESAKLMVYNASRLKDSGANFIKEAAMCKLHASQVAEKVASTALEVFGGYGFIKEYPIEKYYRDAKIGKLYEGTSNMQLATIFKIIDKEING